MNELINILIFWILFLSKK